MTFDEILTQIRDLLRRQGRVSYRALRRRFDLDDDYLEDLKIELIKAERIAIDEDGEVLVWRPTSLEEPSDARGNTVNQAPSSSDRMSDGERRQLTVMFCDLAESTRLSGLLDPEDLREIIRTYQSTCATAIQRFGGYIAQYLGDGVLVYFGYPHAHEDDPQRAVRSAFGIINAIAEMNTRVVQDRGLQLAVRIGLHTGVVVVGEMGGGGRHEDLAVGDTPNIAARLQSLAALNTAVISATTARLVEKDFTCRALGPHKIKGIDAAVQVYQVLGESAAQTSSGVRTPLIGRDAELALLRQRWAQSADGRGQVVLLTGEAGIGKSRLVSLLTDEVTDEAAQRLMFRCSPYHSDTSFYPLIDRLQRILRSHRDTPSDMILSRLEEMVAPAGLPVTEAVPLIAALLTLPVPGQYPPLALSPQRQKQKTLEILVSWMVAIARQQPLLAVCEDLHWADPSTLEFLGLLIDQVPTARLLLVLTCRPDFQAPWGFRSYVAPLTLTRLTRPQVEQLILRATGERPLPAEVAQQIAAKTDGIPLFVEELVKSTLESGLLESVEERYVVVRPLESGFAIPTTLQSALMARLDRLPLGRSVAQLGATVGREFSYDLLQRVSPIGEPTLQTGLEELLRAELLYQRGLPPVSEYVFKHALVRDAAYQSLLRSTRQHYHQRIAKVLTQHFLETVQTQPELVAHHYTEGALYDEGLRYWRQAGQRAVQRSAHVEAVSHFTKALEVLKNLPEGPQRSAEELSIRFALATPLIVTKGYGAREVEQLYSRARELCAQGGTTAQRVQALSGLFVFYELRGALNIAHELTDEMLALARQQRESVPMLRACSCAGQTAFLLGDFGTARDLFEQGLSVYDPEQHKPHVLGHWQEGTYLSFLSLVLWIQGYPDKARETSGAALKGAKELDPYSRIFASFYAACLHQFLDDAPETQQHADAMKVVSAEHGFAVFSAVAPVFRGWAVAAAGNEPDGVAEVRKGLDAYRAMGTEFLLPYFLGVLASATQSSVDDRLSIIAEALDIVEKNGERFYEAELHRLRGESLLALSPENAAAADACFHQALMVARRQRARSWELRAAISLSRSWQRQDKKDAARELVAPIYGWFSEGFSTRDLRQAQTLLGGP
jgi:class 3 adenylate cyclase/predicted ATPase